MFGRWLFDFSDVSDTSTLLDLQDNGKICPSGRWIRHRYDTWRQPHVRHDVWPFFLENPARINGGGHHPGQIIYCPVDFLPTCRSHTSLSWDTSTDTKRLDRKKEKENVFFLSVFPVIPRLVFNGMYQLIQWIHCKSTLDIWIMSESRHTKYRAH